MKLLFLDDMSDPQPPSEGEFDETDLDDAALSHIVGGAAPLDVRHSECWLYADMDSRVRP